MVMVTTEPSRLRSIALLSSASFSASVVRAAHPETSTMEAASRRSATARLTFENSAPRRSVGSSPSPPRLLRRRVQSAFSASLRGREFNPSPTVVRSWPTSEPRSRRLPRSLRRAAAPPAAAQPRAEAQAEGPVPRWGSGRSGFSTNASWRRSPFSPRMVAWKTPVIRDALTPPVAALVAPAP
jgi:hypothetical protein